MSAPSRFIINFGIKPEIGQVLPMEQAKDAFRAMVESRTRGKTIFNN
jgi:D-arabinose 1-dehydrogenase-like Zn-dependent alcohol dehydrogenase